MNNDWKSHDMRGKKKSGLSKNASSLSKPKKTDTSGIPLGGAGGGNVLGSMKQMAIAEMNAQLKAGRITQKEYQGSLKMINQTFKPVKRTWGKDIDRSKIKKPKTIRLSNTVISADTALDSSSVSAITATATAKDSC